MPLESARVRITSWPVCLMSCVDRAQAQAAVPMSIVPAKLSAECVIDLLSTEPTSTCPPDSILIELSVSLVVVTRTT